MASAKPPYISVSCEIGNARHVVYELLCAAKTALLGTEVENNNINKMTGMSTHSYRLFYWNFGSGGRDRTYDQLINSQLLYR